MDNCTDRKKTLCKKLRINGLLVVMRVIFLSNFIFIAELRLTVATTQPSTPTPSTVASTETPTKPITTTGNMDNKL